MYDIDHKATEAYRSEVERTVEYLRSRISELDGDHDHTTACLSIIDALEFLQSNRVCTRRCDR